MKNLKDLKKEIWEQQNLWERIQSIWWGNWFKIQDKWWLITGTCPHESTVGRVNAKKVTCLLCGKKVDNK